MQRDVNLSDLRRDYPLYARSCLTVVTKGGSKLRLHLNRSQRKVQATIDKMRARGRPPRIVALKARQVGISTDTQGRMFHGVHLNPNRTALTIAHKRDSARQIVTMSKTFLAHLPKGIAPKIESETKLNFLLSNGSKVDVEVATEGGGRGWTAQYLHLSEFARYPNPSGVLGGALDAVPATTDSLIVVESTAKGMNEFYDLYVQAKTGQSDWAPIFIPWHEDEGYRLHVPPEGLGELDKDERDLVRRFHLDDAQLAWRRFKIREKKGDKLLYQQEYPCDDREAFVVTGSPVFEKDTIDFYADALTMPGVVLPEPREIEWDADERKHKMNAHSHGRFHVYQEPLARHLYVVAVDCSEGDAGSDPSPIVVLDRMTLDIVAVWDGRQRPDLLARTSAAICDYYNKGRCIWEANGPGLAFQIEFERLWDDYYMREASQDSVSRKLTDKAGFYTSPKTRSYLFNILRRFVENRMGKIPHPRLVAEISWLYFEEGFRGERRVEAPAGKTKDLCIATALALEEHRGSPDNDLAPLAAEDRSFALTELRRHKIAQSMGHESKLDIPHGTLTADEVAELDEMEYQGSVRRARRGIGTPS